MNRIAVLLDKGDTALIFVLAQRLPEGKVLTYEEISKLQYSFVIARVL